MKSAGGACLGATLASVALCGSTVPPLEWWVLVPFCWAPFIAVLPHVSVARAVRLGLAHGVLLTCFGFHWLVAGLVDAGRMSLPGALALFSCFALAQGGRTALIALLTALAVRRGYHAALGFPFAVVAAELVYPLFFPWHFALFASPVLEWVQLAEFGGPLFVSFWVAATNSLFAWAWQRRCYGWPAAARAALWGVGLVLAVTLLGSIRVRAVEREIAGAPMARVGLVQGNQYARARATTDAAELYREKTFELLAREPRPDLVIWPETALPSPVSDSVLGTTLSESVLRDWSGNARPGRIDVPLLLGMVVRTDAPTSEPGLDPSPSFALTNSAILSDSAGHLTGRYDKRELVPIGERSVFASSLPLLGKFFTPVNEFSPGEIRPAMTVGNHRLGVSICYEDIQHRGIRDSVKRVRPDLLVNLTSDAWFAGSLAPSMHLALATLRAVEHRRYLVRATTTGVTSLTDPTGRVVYRLPENTPVAGVAVARWLSPSTIYESFGDWPWVALTAAAFVFVLLGLGRRPHQPLHPRDRRRLYVARFELFGGPSFARSARAPSETAPRRPDARTLGTCRRRWVERVRQVARSRGTLACCPADCREPSLGARRLRPSWAATALRAWRRAQRPHHGAFRCRNGR